MRTPTSAFTRLGRIRLPQYGPKDEVIGWFWDTLEAMSHREREQFLHFACARSRLPERRGNQPTLHIQVRRLLIPHPCLP
jgi:hypothetical protein